MIKTFGIAIAVILVVAVVFVAGTAYAQTGTPQPQGTQQGFGRGMMGGGMMGGRQGDPAGGGLLSDEMHKALAAKLGLTAEELTARESKGETAWEIAQARGISAADFQKLMTDARSTAIESLLKQGKITQQQADWFKNRSQAMPMWNMEDTDGDGQPECPMYENGTPNGAAVSPRNDGAAQGFGGMRGRMGR